MPLRQKLRDTVVYVFPLATIIFVVTGLIFLGIATPTESAGLGALSALILAKLYGKLDWPTAASNAWCRRCAPRS